MIQRQLRKAAIVLATVKSAGMTITQSLPPLAISDWVVSPEFYSQKFVATHATCDFPLHAVVQG